MGSYCSYKIGEWELASTKSRVEPDLTVPFQESDKVIGYDVVDGKRYRTVKYVCSAEQAKARLDSLGYTIKSAATVLKHNQSHWLKEYGYLIPSSPRGLKNAYAISEIYEWIEAFKIIRENGYQIYSSWDDDRSVPNGSPLVQIALDMDGAFFGFPHNDNVLVFRMFLESCPRDTPITLDISDLVGGGYYGSTEKVCSNVNSRKKVILITEGSTDKEFLEKSLGLLFPHMVDYYSFLDFSTFSVAGGVDKLTYIVKAFSGVGIENRIIALFDNDAVGTKEYNTLLKLKLPSNIKVLKLPDIDIAKKYPTIGPTGDVEADINGKACSLELYLGQDILKSEDGRLKPVVWGGYIDTKTGYQGEVKEKRTVQDAFRNKVSEAVLSKKSFREHDWVELIEVWEHIFKAYL